MFNFANVVPGLVMTNSLLLKMAIEIVDFPINSMVIFHSYVNVYQRVNIWSHRHAVYVEWYWEESPVSQNNYPIWIVTNLMDPL